MSHSRFARAPGFAALAVSVSFCAVSAQAGPVETIYSAENALYGAGYDIGKADGWMDNTLRSAIRQYQSEHDELQATGNLDPQTLSALGVAPESDSTVSGNDVADRKAAMAALGLSEVPVAPGSTDRAVAEVQEPKAQPEPEPEVQRQLVPEPEPEVELVSQEPEDTIESDPAPDVQEVTASAPEEPVEAPTEQAAAEPETAEPAAQPEPRSEPEVASEPKFKLPEEPTGAGNPEVSEPVEPVEVSEAEKPSGAQETSDSAEVASSPGDAEPEAPASSSGGFFATLFDFLFGWLI